MERMAAVTGPERNEFLLLADVLGVSQLIESLNHDRPGQPVGFALVGPFFRANAPFRERAEPDVSDDTAGTRVRISGRVDDFDTKASIEGAILNTWQAATNGLYENQDSNQPDYNLRGCYKSGQDGTYEIIGLYPTPYPVPTDGPVGELLRAAKRAVGKPAHIHYRNCSGYETLITQIFVKDDKDIPADAVFTANDRMVGEFKKENDHYSLNYDFRLRRGVSINARSSSVRLSVLILSRNAYSAVDRASNPAANR
jgi:catechol 1,2-dioxygenase